MLRRGREAGAYLKAGLELSLRNILRYQGSTRSRYDDWH